MRLLVPFRKFLAELKRRRVLEVVAIYGGLSFALLQSADIVVDSLGISPTLLTALTLLVLFGFPVAVAFGWVYDIDSRGRLHRTPKLEPAELPTDAAADEEAPRSLGWPVRVGGIAAAILLVSVSWITAGRIQRAEASPDPRGSYLVSPISARFQTPEDLEAASRAVRILTRQLRGWDNVRTVQSFALEGMLLRLGIEESEVPTLEQAFEMAEEQGVGTVIAVSVERQGEDLALEAVMFDVSTRREVGEAILQTGSALDLGGLVEPVAENILRLRNQTASFDELRSESRNPAAHQDFEAGLDALHDWRLEAAEVLFREAIQKDSLFAIAHHYLALALYWQTSRDPHRILDVGPEIARYTQAANRLAESRNSRPGFRAHMQAFGAFWRGDYEGARQGYREILDKNRSDTEAWLLLGSVEFNDPMLREVAPDSLVPRRNLNIARKAFETAAELSPDWQISYGHLFSIDRQVAGATLFLRCPAFERPGTPTPSMFEQVQAGDQVAFCPFVDDSVIWVKPSDIDAERRRRAIDDVEQLTARSRNLLENWTQIHPEQARPHDELASWLAWRRSTLGCKAEPTEVRDLTTAILVERTASLAIRSDTTREDLIRHAVLLLATEDIAGAESLMERALDELPTGSAVAGETVNLYLALGMTRRALEIAEPIWSTRTWAIRDPDGSGNLSLGDIARPISELQMYGATGLDPHIQLAFEALFEEWDQRGYTENQSVHVRRLALRQGGIGPALAMLPGVRSRWFEGWEEAGVVIPTVWKGFLAVDAATDTQKGMVEVDSLLDAVLQGLEQANPTILRSHYLAARLAQLAGRHGDAIEQLHRVEACPLSLQDLSVDWGLRTLGRLHRARSYFALADTILGREALAGYSALRADGGSIKE